MLHLLLCHVWWEVFGHLRLHLLHVVVVVIVVVIVVAAAALVAFGCCGAGCFGGVAVFLVSE